MANNYNNSYNKVIYESHPVNYKEFIDNKYDSIHKELFEYANKRAYECFIADISKYVNNENDVVSHISDSMQSKLDNIIKIYHRINTYENFLKNVNVIEIGANEYWKCSEVIWRTKQYPFNILSVTTKYSENDSLYWLSSKCGKMDLSYWWNKDTERFDDTSMNPLFNGYEITSINYVSGKVTLYNRQTDNHITTSLNSIRENMPLSDEYTLNNTFTEMYYNK